MIRTLVAAVLLFCLSGQAWADRRVAVAVVEGDDKGGTAAKLIVSALDGEGDLIVISPKAVTKVADELAIAVDDRQSGKLMDELEADALVMGMVEAISGGSKLTLRIVPKGVRKSKSAVVLYGKKANPDRIRSGIRNAVTTVLAKSAPVAQEEDGPTTLESEDEGSTGGRVVPKRAITGGSGKKGDKRFVTFKEEQPEGEVTKGEGDEGGSDGEGEGGEEGEETEDGGKRAGKKEEPRKVAARLSAGPSFSTRTLQFNHRAFDQAPKDYSNSPVPGLRVQAEVYPLAFGSRGFLSNFGIAFELDQTFGLKVNAGAQKLPTTVRHFSVGARLRIPLGSAELALVGGYGQRTFKIVRGMTTMLDLPDVDYKLFDPGLAFRVPLGPVAFVGDARFLLMTDAGQIQTNTSYGPGDVSAFEGELGLEVAISRTIGVKLSGDFTSIGYDFTGTGDMARNRDADPTTVDVGGAAERYVGGALTLGIAY